MPHADLNRASAFSSRDARIHKLTSLRYTPIKAIKADFIISVNKIQQFAVGLLAKGCAFLMSGTLARKCRPLTLFPPSLRGDCCAEIQLSQTIMEGWSLFLSFVDQEFEISSTQIGVNIFEIVPYCFARKFDVLRGENLNIGSAFNKWGE